MDHIDILYYKIFDSLIVLRDVRDQFHTYSANDIKKLISSKINSKKRGPKDLELLYNLETMIRDIRESFIVAKNELNKDNLTS
jgi:hypothetical protein